MLARDHFHTGIVVADLDAELARLTALLGYEWADELDVVTPVRFAGKPEPEDVRFRFRYSRTTPRLELIEERPGTIWVPVEPSGLHHLGYWSDDLAADGAQLTAAGYACQAEGVGPDNQPGWAYYGGSDPGTPRIELVARSMQPFLEALYG